MVVSSHDGDGLGGKAPAICPVRCHNGVLYALDVMLRAQKCIHHCICGSGYPKISKTLVLACKGRSERLDGSFAHASCIVFGAPLHTLNLHTMEQLLSVVLHGGSTSCALSMT